MPLSSGEAQLTVSSLIVGSHPVTATYSGDGNFVASSYVPTTLTVGKATSTTTITSNLPNPSVVGQAVTVVFAVAPQFTGTPTGSVTVTASTGQTCSATLAAGAGSCQLTLTAAGTPTLTAAYSGDGNFLAGKSPGVSQTVNPTTPTITWAAPGAVTYGTALSATQLNATASVPGTFVYTPAAGTVLNAGSQTLSVSFTPTDKADYTTATATVALTVNKATPIITWAAPAAITYGTALGAIQLNATTTVPGTFVYTPAAGMVVDAGSQTLSVSFTPTDTTDYTTATATVGLTVNKAASSTTVVSSLNPSTYSQAVAFTATVSSNVTKPTGTVTFIDGATTLGTGSVNSSGQAAFVTAALAAGTHSVTAVYSGDANFNGSQSSAVSQAVAKAATTTSLTSSPNPSFQYQTVNFVATVIAKYGGAVSGTVTFMEGAVKVWGTASLVNGSATLALSTTGVGSHTITAVYGGDGNDLGSTSPAITQTVLSKTATTTTVASSPNPSYVGQSVTLTATVSPLATTGTVSFMQGQTILGTRTLGSGQATFTTSSLPAGSLSITAVYSGDTQYNSSTSATLTQQVNQAATSITISSAPNPSSAGQLVTFTATATWSPAYGGTPTGTVDFKVGNTTLGRGTLDATGTATFSTSTLASGRYNVRAVYGGSPAYTGSASSAITQVVQ
jgi:hypothetical protein